MSFPIPPDEPERLRALKALGVLDSDPEATFDELVDLAATVCGTPISLVSLVDESRQWFKARHGIDAAETPRDIAFCAHAIMQNSLFEVRDALEDDRFATNPLVIADPKIRFYAGVPLTTDQGHNLGTLCVIDHVPRNLTPAQRATLETLGHAVTAQLELRGALVRAAALDRRRDHAEKALRKSTELLSTLTSISSAALADLDLRSAFERILDVLIRISGSEYGFIGEILERADGSHELKTHASRNVAWNAEAPDADGRRQAPAATLERLQPLLDAVMSNGEPLIGSDRSFLAVPFRTGTTVSGMIGVGNAAGGYDESVITEIEPILAACGSFVGNIRLERERHEALEALRRSEEQHRLLVESSLDAIVAIDESGAITSWNPQAETIFGWKPEEAAGRDFFDTLTPARHRSNHRRVLEELLAGDAGFSTRGRRVEITALRRQGEEFPAEVAVSRFPTERGVGFSVFIRDISDKAESERAVRVSERRLRQTLAAAQAGVWEWDFVNARGFWSEEDFKLLGYEPGSIEPSLEAFLAHVHEEDRPGAVAAVDNAVAERASFDNEYRVVRADGSIRWLRDIGKVECDESGGLLRVSGIVTDVTERKRAELELAETTSRLTALIQNLDAGLIVEDESGVVRVANREFCSQFGITGPPERLIGADFQASEPKFAQLFEDPAQLRADVERTLRDRVLVSAAEVRLRDGRTLERDYVPIRAAGRYRGHLWQYRDVTERKRAERELLEKSNQLSAANAELERASRLKDEFLAAMSHELRTPLNAVLGLAEGLRAGVFGSVSADQAQQLAIIEDSGRHLLHIINDILDLSKIGAGKLELSTSSVNPSAICEASLRMVREGALRKKIRLSAKYDPALTSLRADPLRLRQILVNLLSNAVKFTPVGGSVLIETSCAPDDGRACFTVSDDGIGIAAEDLSRLFMPFVQLDSRLAREHEGTGLGLSLVQRLAELHGGGVSVETSPGRGSRFTVALPWCLEEEELPGDRNAADEAHHASAVNSIQGRRAVAGEGEPPLLLIVDDHEVHLRLLSSYLAGAGYRVAMARGGMEAIERAMGDLPALILMDVRMQGVDGFEATRRIRKIQQIGTTPIIALTALAMPGDREKSLAAGMDAYFEKPLSLAKLSEVIERQIASHAAARPSR